MCLILASLFGECEASPRSGVFIEGGFETGMLETQQQVLQRVTKTINEPFVPLGAIQKMGSELFSTADSIAKLKFSAREPIQIRFDAQKNAIVVENFLPYNLDKVQIKVTDIQGHEIYVGILETLPKQSLMSIPKETFESLKGVDLNQADFNVNHSSQSSEMTQRVFRAIDAVSANIFLEYKNQSYSPGLYCKEGIDCNAVFNKEWAGLYTDLVLNMAYVYSTDEWKNAILNAPFDFTNRNSPSDCNKDDLSTCVTPKDNGLAPSGTSKEYFVSPESIVKNFTDTMTIEGHLLKDSNVEGYGTPLGNSSRGALAIETYNLLPSKLYNADYTQIQYALSVILHEYSHTRGYSHNGNMTYPVDDTTYDVCATHPNYPNCAKVPAGFVGVTRSVWNDLLGKNALPINYKDLDKQQDLLLPSQASANTLISTINESISAMQSVSKANKSATLGFNFKLGYQQYFNNYFGLSYYGIVKYNYAKANNFAKKINQVGLGIGVEALLDFTKNFGIFSGFRGLYNRYSLLNQNKNTGNIEFVGGINFWGKKSKYSIGVSLPLIQRNMKVAFNNPNAYGHVILKEGVSHFNVFFNYGWVF